MKDLGKIYKMAAERADGQGISAADQTALVSFIRGNCIYDEDKEFFLVLGIGCELADIQARRAGYKNEVDRAYTAAKEATR
jgi:hypothetical protein